MRVLGQSRTSQACLIHIDLQNQLLLLKLIAMQAYFKQSITVAIMEGQHFITNAVTIFAANEAAFITTKVVVAG